MILSYKWVPVKKILIIALLLQFQLSLAGQSPYYIVSHKDVTDAPTTFLHQGFDFYFLQKWSGCTTIGYTVEPQVQYEIVGNEIKVLYRFGLGGSTVCASPWPLVYLKISDLPNLTRGSYHLSYYRVPYNDIFPPNVVDLPTYLVEDLNFEVLASIKVDTLSPWSLILLVLLLMIVGLNVFKQRKWLN